MTDSNEFNLIIISDLHLSEGRDPLTMKLNRNEDFFSDSKFDRFLSYLDIESKRHNRKWNLIIAGDMVDFLQVTSIPDNSILILRKSEKEYGLGTSSEKTVWKMKVMMEGHSIFFKALGKFLANRNKCTIISGNHDIEWTLSEVQNAFKEEMKKYLPSEIGNENEIVYNRIEFFPWFYYEPGLIWVEHGHQYDGMNSFDYLLAPHLPNNNELMLPSGSFFVRYLFNKVEQKDPFADNIKPISAYIKKYVLKLIFSKNIRKHIAYFCNILRKVKKFKKEEFEEVRKQNESGISELAKHFAIDLNLLKSLRTYWVPCFLYNKGKLFNLKSFITYKAENSYKKIAFLIQEKLSVRYVVFGHTHKTDIFVLKVNQKSYYANSGTWTKIFSENLNERLLHEEQESIFVQVIKNDGNKLSLMKWRDEIGQGELINLFE